MDNIGGPYRNFGRPANAPEKVPNPKDIAPVTPEQIGPLTPEEEEALNNNEAYKKALYALSPEGLQAFGEEERQTQARIRLSLRSSGEQKRERLEMAKTLPGQIRLKIASLNKELTSLQPEFNTSAPTQESYPGENLHNETRSEEIRTALEYLQKELSKIEQPSN
jgi:chromosome segregation ATPase